MGDQQPPHPRRGRELAGLPAGQVQRRRQIGDIGVGGLGQQHVGPPGQVRDPVAGAGVTAVDQRRAVRGEPDGVALDGVLGPRRLHGERAELRGHRGDPEVEDVGERLAALLADHGQPPLGARRRDQRDPPPRTAARPAVPDDERGDVEAVVGVQVGEHDRVDGVGVGHRLERAERTVPQVQQHPEAVVLDEVAGRRRRRARAAARAADHREPHRYSRRIPMAPVRLTGSGTARGTSAVPLGPELALERGGRLVERAGVGAGGEVLPATVADDEDDVGPAAGRDLLVGDPERGVQDRAGRDPGEDALALHQLAGAVDGVVGAHAEARVQQRGVVELGDEALVDVAQAVDQLAVARLGGDHLDARACAPGSSARQPMRVPVVPRPATKWVIDGRSARISGPVPV